MKFVPLIILVLLIAGAVIVSCSEKKENIGPADQHRLIITQAELDEQEHEDSLAGTVSFSQSEFKGMTLFMQHCNKCHPGGEKGEGPSLIDKKVLPDMLIHFQVRAGMGAMPSFDKNVLSKSDVKKIIAFIGVLREEGGQE